MSITREQQNAVHMICTNITYIMAICMMHNKVWYSKVSHDMYVDIYGQHMYTVLEDAQKAKDCDVSFCK